MSSYRRQGDDMLRGDVSSCIDDIEELRDANNGNWMNLLRLALRVAPDEAKHILEQIYEHDKQINKVLRELVNETRD